MTIISRRKFLNNVVSAKEACVLKNVSINYPVVIDSFKKNICHELYKYVVNK